VRSRTPARLATSPSAATNGIWSTMPRAIFVFWILTPGTGTWTRRGGSISSGGSLSLSTRSLHGGANVAELPIGRAGSTLLAVILLPVLNFRGGVERLLSDRREVTASGETMPLTPCPLDEAFWNRYIRGRMVYLAEHGRELGLDGAILDPEMYGADHTTYDTVCYCADCLREFCRAGGREVPNPLPPAERAAWLKRNGLEQRFEQHFLDRVKGFCRRIERECHARNPDFLLGTLHPDLEGPFTRGLAMGLGSARCPLLGFSEMTYSI
jgi:hypothetical protein